MRDGFAEQQNITADLQSEVHSLKADVQSIRSSQGEISEQVGAVQGAVQELGKQLAAINLVLKTLVPSTSRVQEQQSMRTSADQTKSPTLQQDQGEQ